MAYQGGQELKNKDNVRSLRKAQSRDSKPKAPWITRPPDGWEELAKHEAWDVLNRLGIEPPSLKPTFVQASKEVVFDRAEFITRLRNFLTAVERVEELGVIPYAKDVDLVTPWPDEILQEAGYLSQILNSTSFLMKIAGYHRCKTGGRPPRNFRGLSAHYNRLKPELGDAKGWIEKRWPKWQSSPPQGGWKNAVRNSYPDLYDLADDLIERLSPNPQLSDLVEKLLEKKDHDISQVAYIALEAAARRCGCGPYEYTARHLFTQLGEAEV